MTYKFNKVISFFSPIDSRFYKLIAFHYVLVIRKRMRNGIANHNQCPLAA